jgi:hypothetical protein
VNARRGGLLAVCVAVLSIGSGCAGMFRAMGLPPNPARETLPPGIETRALAVGADAPEFSLLSATGDHWTLSEKRQSGPVVLAFYRGHW